MARLQGHSEQEVQAPAASIWALLEDPARLPDWVPVVDRVTEHSESEKPGSIRRCEVAMGGRRGYMVERCVEALPERRLRHEVVDDSLGFTRMFRDYSFTLSLEPTADDATLVACETFYEPRGAVARLANALLMRRRFAAVRRDILDGLKRLAEGRRSSSTSTAASTSAPPAS
jgi:uncharacterized protein YndB with AHSA1/START domain